MAETFPTESYQIASAGSSLKRSAHVRARWPKGLPGLHLQGGKQGAVFLYRADQDPALVATQVLMCITWCCGHGAVCKGRLQVTRLAESDA